MSWHRFGVWLVLILASIAVLVRAKAAAPPCAAEESSAALRTLTAQHTPAASWANLHQQFERFAACDDGAVGDAFSEAVSKLLADRWMTLVDLVDLGRIDPVFRQFVIGHIDASADDADLIKIARNADHSCPRGAPALCRDIASAAAQALAAQRGTHAGDPEMPACRGDPRIIGKCFAVRGLLSIRANMRPYLAVTGTKRVIGIASPEGAMIMPPEITAIFKRSVNSTVIGDFTVCPFTWSRLGVMQLACIAAADKVTLRKAHATGAGELSPAALREEIAARGARAVVDRLWNAPTGSPAGAWLAVEGQVARGSDEWLAVAAALAPGTDAGMSHGLEIALHHALAKNPEAVLRMLPRLPYSVASVCGNGDDEEPPRQAALELRATRAAVNRVRELELRPQRDACRKTLDELNLIAR